ncbi:MAG: iron-containing alcohol dehydrogenase [Planctomycetaceae bacterium]|nr:iron-containing alcohol dehydrogenase [Planctomycetales bacterium]MCB9872590.1 iron-containing alcohol dehydrogenase [Planctomycetaceae bacterium]MCB9939584.1 iron-containing alcohol dehydrogenase [Planctomycetaceae bacterium]
MQYDTAFQMAASNIRFGTGTTAEVGMDLQAMEAKRVMLVIDSALVELPTGIAVRQALKAAGVAFDQYDRVSIEPTAESFQAAAIAATEGGYDAFVAVGGGSTIDTAKAANLYSTHPTDFFDYVNAPIGRGLPVPGPLKPLIAIPTTSGTGSETTGVAIFDYVDKHAKTGISHRFLKPTLGIIDPDNTRTLPPAVAAASGLDVLSHALESFTAIAYTLRPKPESPTARPAYQGANPISDIWALRALEMVNESLVRAVEDPSDDEARGQMLLAAAIAGIGFGNAGVHLPHAMSYPVAGMVRDFRPTGYDVDHALVPHGISVILHTPAVARFTAPSSPARHLRAAQALGADVAGASHSDAAAVLAERVIELMRALNMPNGLKAVGYATDDIPALVEGTLQQQRITKLSPIEAGRTELAQLFQDSLTLW